MPCSKCGTKAGQPASASLSSKSFTVDTFYPNFGSVPMAFISAREQLVIHFTNSTLYLGTAQLVSVPREVVDPIIAAGVPIWIF